MAEKLDYAHLGFAYHVPEKRYVSNYRNGAWDKGCLSEDSNVVLNESAGIFAGKTARLSAFVRT